MGQEQGAQGVAVCVDYPQLHGAKAAHTAATAAAAVPAQHALGQLTAGRRVSAASPTPQQLTAGHRSSSRGRLVSATSPTAPAAADDSSCNGAGGSGADGLGAASPALYDSARGRFGVIGASDGPPDLLGSIEGEGEDYGSELPYDAAQLSALASCKSFSQRAQGPYSTSGSGSGNFQRLTSSVVRHTSSMLSLHAPECDGEESEACDITPVPFTDHRPTQFACSGRYQVLCADDDPVSQTVVRSLLASSGYEVVCVYSGQQTLEYIENAEVLPDLILLDMLMPDMSG